MSMFLKDISFHGILLDSLFEDERQLWDKVRDLMTEGIKSGVVQPLHYTAFKRDKLESAFRFLASGEHHEKVVLEVCCYNTYQIGIFQL